MLLSSTKKNSDLYAKNCSENKKNMQTRIETYLNRPTRAEISISSIKNNLDVVKNITGPSVRIMAMVKSNAYGHGILEISETLLESGADCLGVAYLEEAVYLRNSGITAPILVCGAINTDQIDDFLKYSIQITSSSKDKSAAISSSAVRLGKTAKVHLKIDTGMERIGVHWYNAEKFIEHACNLPGLEIKGVFSHLAKADSDKDFTNTQISRFKKIIRFMENNGICPEMVHLSNSAGIMRYPEAHFNMVRPGIMLYGYNPFGYGQNKGEYENNIRPAMSLKSKVAYFKVCPENTGISYNHTHLTEKNTRIITLPIGYGDGYSRLLSNRGIVGVRNRIHPVVGNICMDQLMVDIGPEGTAYNGDDVLMFGEMDGIKIPLETLCDRIGTITYEFLCNISARVPRIYVD